MTASYLLYGDDELRLTQAANRLEKKFEQVIHLPMEQKDLELFFKQGVESSLWQDSTLYVTALTKDWPSKLVQAASKWAQLLPEIDGFLLLALQKIPQSHPSRKLKNLPWQEVSLLLPQTEMEWQKYLQKRAKDNNVLLSSELATYFLQQLGEPSTWRIQHELYKLSLLSEDQILTKSVIDELITSMEEIPGYLLNDPWAAGKVDKTLASLVKLLVDGKAPISAVMTLARHVRRLASIHYIWKIHGTGADITRYMGGHPFALRQWQQQARLINETRIELALARLAQLESELKGLDPRASRFPELVLLAGIKESIELAHGF